MQKNEPFFVFTTIASVPQILLIGPVVAIFLKVISLLWHSV